jgi:putative ABC transport system ATP-binding protein
MKPVIDAKNIELRAQGRSTPILTKVNVSIMPGEFVVILGHNGSGKSSLVKILSGDKKPTSGEVFVNGVKLSNIGTAERAKDIITITQNPHDRLFLELTLQENIILWESRFGREKLPLKAYEYGKAKWAGQTDNIVANLSGGEKQAFLLALALSHPPSILFLDEHTSALDPKAAKEIMHLTADYINKHKVTTIMVTHRLEDALNYGNRLIIMNEGVVTKDMPKSKGLSVAR